MMGLLPGQDERPLQERALAFLLQCSTLVDTMRIYAHVEHRKIYQPSIQLEPRDL